MKHLFGNLYLMAFPLMVVVLFSSYKQYFGNGYPVSLGLITFVIAFGCLSMIQVGYASHQTDTGMDFCFVIAIAGVVILKKRLSDSLSFENIKFVPVKWLGRTECLQVVALSTTGQAFSFGTISPKKAEQYEMEFNLIKASS
ncbi:hypothetical protein LRP52_23835 [Photobacterium sp. ZSDE20]|uniref:Uncharacterized protein n=1 Tax=Photobacterium pectinilyticum TaxID=2906793 RepID=A0ABT1N1J5_9GAMM|nr:hypothetical protein [Photobacterium sp. ZSDE20]MCQ1058412.1 hypothetical protein [Photobacterium sp. ZSDE20]MDD1825225.1 hypothetical protein [Photobacterium sp. ZSDE20]